jgi:hypothetical protein
MTKFKFSEKYKMIDRIKNRLKKNPDVTEDQVKSYNRRALGPSGAFLMTHIDLIEDLNRDRLYYKNKWLEERDERRRLEVCLENNKYNRMKKLIIEEFGEKSYEYQQVFCIEEHQEKMKKEKEKNDRIQKLKDEISEAEKIGEVRLADHLRESLKLHTEPLPKKDDDYYSSLKIYQTGACVDK